MFFGVSFRGLSKGVSTGHKNTKCGVFVVTSFKNRCLGVFFVVFLALVPQAKNGVLLHSHDVFMPLHLSFFGRWFLTSLKGKQTETVEFSWWRRSKIDVGRCLLSHVWPWFRMRRWGFYTIGIAFLWRFTKVKHLFWVECLSRMVLLNSSRVCMERCFRGDVVQKTMFGRT